MPIIKSALNGGTAEVDDATAKSLIESGHWYSADEAPAPKKRAPRSAVKVAPADAAE